VPFDGWQKLFGEVLASAILDRLLDQRHIARTAFRAVCD
jgi:hypothetical protein